MISGRVRPSADFRLEIERNSGQKISRCYQCGKCTAGCPAAYAMDLGPRRVMRGIQLGLREEVLTSTTIWLCLFCQTCSARCPLEIDIAAVLECLRRMAVAENIRPAERDVELFHRLFLRGVQLWGHAYELGLGGSFNLLSGHPFLNVNLLPRMLATGKLPLLPPRARGASQIKAIFHRVKEMEASPAANQAGNP